MQTVCLHETMQCSRHMLAEVLPKTQIQAPSWLCQDHCKTDQPVQAS